MPEKVNSYKPVYCTNIPRVKEAGIIYISKEFETAIHLCPCGCGVEAVTPFDKAYGWKFCDCTGEVSFEPSILNTACPNRAHYFITNGLVVWS